jgi:formylglycine-generating enzyme required for sulfatase activity
MKTIMQKSTWINIGILVLLMSAGYFLAPQLYWWFSRLGDGELLPTQTPHPSLGVGSSQLSEIDGMRMLYIPAGDFEMGSNLGASAGPSNPRPKHKVYLDAFWIDQTEVSNGQYQLCVDDGECTLPLKTSSNIHPDYFQNPEYENYPVIYVTWYQAKAYCAWAGRRLPTEAEWEKAARGSDGQLYPWGVAAPHPALLNFADNVGDTQPVGSYPDGASPYGVLDMSGNVWEWGADWLDKGYSYYAESPRQNPKGPDQGELRVLRGGSWTFGADRALAAYRLGYPPDSTTLDIGFRCALTP